MTSTEKLSPDELYAQFIESDTVSRCSVSRILTELSDTETVALNKALANPRVSSPKIAKILGSWGHTVSDRAIAHHRRRPPAGCKCKKEFFLD